MKLGSKYSITRTVRHLTINLGTGSESWSDQDVTTEYMVTSISRSLKGVPSTKLKLQNSDRFALGYDSSGTAVSLPGGTIELPHDYRTGSGTIELYEAGETISDGEAVRLHSDGKVWRASALSTYFNKIIGVSTNSVIAGSTICVQTEGIVNNSAWEFELDKPVFCRTAVTSLNIKQDVLEYKNSTASEDMIVTMGVAITETSFLLNIKNTIIEANLRI